MLVSFVCEGCKLRFLWGMGKNGGWKRGKPKYR